MTSSQATQPKLFCFVIMPFSEAFRDVYELGIKEACHAVGTYCERIDEQVFHDSIPDRLYNQIAKADVIIAEMTGKSANVFYEIGYAHALGKPTILITESEQDIPFDLKHFPHVIYGGSISSLRESLKTRVRWYVENPPTPSNRGTIDIELYLGSERLAAGEAVLECPSNQYPCPRISIVNNSTQTLHAGEFSLGLITQGVKRVWARVSEKAELTHAELPTGERLYVVSGFQTVYPQQVTTVSFTIAKKPTTDPFKFVFRIYTAAGYRDYPLTVICSKSDSE